MSDKPDRLQQHCMNLICDSADILHNVQGSPLNESLSEQLLLNLSERGKLNDETLSAFTPNATSLRKVVIHHSEITRQGLHVLRGHRVTHLELVGNRELVVSDIPECLGEWSRSNLRVLIISRNKSGGDPKSWAKSLSQFTNLHTLNVSYTKLDQDGLEVLVENLPGLEGLDISSNPIHDITPLKKLRSCLKSLSIYNLRLNKKSDPVSVLSELSELVQLDISTEPPQGLEQLFHPLPDAETERFRVPVYLSRPEINPNLVSLDVSGADSVKPKVLKAFLDAHPSLTFLGMAFSDMSGYDMFRPFDDWFKAHPNLKIAGKGTDDQMKECLRRYLHRPEYLTSALKALFPYAQYLEDPREDIIELVLPAWRRYPTHPTLQWASTALMGHLTNNDLSLNILPEYLKQFIELTVTAMENFPDHHEIQHNAIQALCNVHMMQLPNLDWFRPLNVVMDLLCSSDDADQDQMSVFFCSQLIKKMSREQVTKLGTTEGNLDKLLYLVRNRLTNYDESDMTLRCAVASLLSLTDECPLVSKKLMEKVENFDTLVELLRKAQSGNDSQETFIMIIRTLCVLGNIGEVEELQSQMVREDFLQHMRCLLEHDRTDVFFSATANLVHLCTGNEEAWAKLGGLEKSGVLEDLRKVTDRLENVEELAFSYRSLAPFYPPLQSPETSIQLWAIWTLRFLCATDGRTYLPMLIKEEGDNYIKTLMTSSSDPKVKKLCEQVLAMVDKIKGKRPR